MSKALRLISNSFFRLFAAPATKTPMPMLTYSGDALLQAQAKITAHECPACERLTSFECSRDTEMDGTDDARHTRMCCTCGAKWLFDSNSHMVGHVGYDQALATYYARKQMALNKQREQMMQAKEDQRLALHRLEKQTRIAA